MAQRYGGKYSPDAVARDTSGPQTEGRASLPARRAFGSARANLLYLAPVPLLFTAFTQDAIGMAIDLAAAATLVFGAFTLSEGLKAEAAYEARKVARRPALPRKIIAAALAGLGVSLACLAPESGGSAAYQAMDPGHCDAHLHLKCVDCGRLIHLDEDVSDALQSDLLRAAGFTVDGRSTTIYGTCAACGRKRDGHA